VPSIPTIELPAPVNGAIRSVLNALTFATIAARSSRKLTLDVTALPLALSPKSHAPCDPKQDRPHGSTCCVMHASAYGDWALEER
jgi:hypothetical protein